MVFVAVVRSASLLFCPVVVTKHDFLVQLCSFVCRQKRWKNSVGCSGVCLLVLLGWSANVTQYLSFFMLCLQR